MWSRSKFSDLCKVDYINNNLSESFNSWVPKTKDMKVVDMLGNIRKMIVTKFDVRSRVARKMEGRIIPSVTKALTAQRKAIKYHEVLRCADGTAEVTVSTITHVVNLEHKSCTCRAWQVSGKTCSHALALLIKQSRHVDMNDYVHEYDSVERLRATYAGVFNPMTSKHLWPEVDIGYKISKPKLRRKVGRPKVARIKPSDEVLTKKRRKCIECNELGHTTRYCQGGLTTRQKKDLGNNEPSETTTPSDRGRGRGRVDLANNEPSDIGQSSK
jgi:hypothetical protein